jgi:hypothetical protein
MRSPVDFIDGQVLLDHLPTCPPTRDVYGRKQGELTFSVAPVVAACLGEEVADAVWAVPAVASTTDSAHAASATRMAQYALSVCVTVAAGSWLWV